MAGAAVPSQAAALSALNCTPPAQAEEGVAYTATCTPTGGTGVLTYTLDSGTLPPGATLNSTTGSVTGTLNAGSAGAYTFVIRVTDAADAATFASSVSSTVLAPPAVSCTGGSTFSTLENTAAFTGPVCTVSGGAAPYALAAVKNGQAGASTLPTGVTLSVTAIPTTATTSTLSGTPTAGGEGFGFAVQVTDNLAKTGLSANFTGTVANTLTLTCTPVITFEVGATLSPGCTQTGGSGTITWSLQGAVPTGLSMNAAGAVSGTITGVIGTPYDFQIQVQDSASSAVTKQSGHITGTVIAGPSYSCDTPAIEEGVAYTRTCTVVNPGTAGYTWSIPSGKPSWLTLNQGNPATLTGTPSAGTGGTSPSFTLTLTDSATPSGVASSATQTLNIAAPPAVSCTGGSAFSTLEVNVAFTGPVCTVSGGVAPYTLSAVKNGQPGASTLPTGVGLTVTAIPTTATTSTLSGTPTVALEGFGFAVQVQDNLSITKVSANFTNTVAAALSATCGGVGTLEVGVSYTVTCSLTGGVAPYAWSVASGTVPGGLGSGIPAPSNGAAPTLTAGFSTAQTASYQLKVTDSASIAQVSTATTALGGLIIPAPSLSCQPGTGPVQVGIPYSTACTVSNGTPPYTFTTTGGTLPAGLTSSPVGSTALTVGTVFGTPSTTGAFNYNVQVADSATTIKTASQNFVGTVVAGLTFSCAPITGPTEVGVPYSAACNATGATAPYNWLITNGSLPNGLSLSSATGASVNVSGTPGAAAAGGYSYTVQVISSGAFPQTLTQTYSGSVTPAPAVNCVANGPVTVGVNYSATCSVTGGVAPYTWSVSAGSLPAGVTQSSPNTSTSTTFSGIPTAPAAAFTYAYTAKVTDGAVDSTGTAAPQPATQALSGTIIGAAPTVSCVPATGPTEVNVLFTTTCTASGGNLTYNWTTSALPAGITLGTPTGTGNNIVVVSGRPTTAAASVSFSVTATDTEAPAQSASRAFNATIVDKPSVSCTSGVPLQVGASYSVTCTVAGGVAPYTWSLGAGALPAGVGLSTITGASTTFSGTPTAPAPGTFTYAYTARATDSALNSAGVVEAQFGSQALSGTIIGAAPTVSCVPATGPTEVNVQFTTTCTASGGNLTYSWTTSTLPAGITLGTPTGTGTNTVVVSGKPTTATASVSFSVTATDTETPTQAASQTFNATVIDRPSVSCASPTPPIEVGVLYSVTCSVAGGVAPYTWTVSAGSLPAGVTQSSPNTGTTTTFSGSPTTDGAFAYTVQATDSAVNSAGAADKQSNTVSPTVAAGTGTVVKAPSISCSPTAPPTEVGVFYTTTCTATDGTAPYTWAVTGTLPTGLSTTATQGSTFTISGTPDAVTPTFSYAVTAKDNLRAAPQTITFANVGAGIVARPSVSCTPPAAAEVGVTYTVACTVTGGTQGTGYTWQIIPGATPGNLPAHLTVTPAAGGATATVAMTTGTAPAVADIGAFNYTVRVTDKAVNSAGAPSTLSADAAIADTVAAAPSINCTISGSPVLPAGGPVQVGVSYSVPCSVTGGTGPYTWVTVQAAAPATVGVPTGVTFTPSAAVAVFAGAPSVAAEKYGYSIKVTDSLAQVSTIGPYTGTIQATVQVSCIPATLLTDIGFSKPSVCTVTGGTPNFTFSITGSGYTTTTSVAPQAGTQITVNSKPGSVNAYTDTITVRDATGQTGFVNLPVTVLPAPNVTCSTSAAPIQVAISYSLSCQVAGGEGPYAWKIVGSLPSGLFLNANSANATIAGTPTLAGNAFSYSLQATDKDGLSAGSATYAGTISGSVGVSCASNAGPHEVGVAYSNVCTISGGTPPYTSVNLRPSGGGIVAPGLSLKQGTTANTWVISGPAIDQRPPANYSYSYTLDATDSAPQTASSPLFSDTIVQAPTINCDNTSNQLSVGVFYTITCSAINGSGPYTWNVKTSDLPPGITPGPLANVTKVTLSGIPTKGGSYSYTLGLTDTFQGKGQLALNSVVSRVLRLTAAPSAPETFVLGGTNPGTVSFTVSNDSFNAVAGTVSINFPLPAGLLRGDAAAPVSLGWDCSGSTPQTINCVRSDTTPLSPKGSTTGASYPPVVVRLRVSDAACAGTVTYASALLLQGAAGGDAQVQDTATGTLNAQGCLVISKSHTGNFQAAAAQGQPSQGVYTISVNNVSSASISGKVTVTDQLSPQLTIDPAAGVAGDGWVCTQVPPAATGGPWTVSCTRADTIGPNGTYAPIRLPVTIAGTSCGFVSDQAVLTVSDLPQSSATDATTISGNGCLSLSATYKAVSGGSPAPDAPTAPAYASRPGTLALKPLDDSAPGPGAANGTGTYSITVSNTGVGTFSDPATVSMVLPDGFKAVGPTNDPNWNCGDLSNPVSCKLISPLAGGASAILTVTVQTPATCGASIVPLALNVGALDPQNSQVPTFVPGAGCLSITRAYPSALDLTQPDGTYTLQVTNPGAAISAPVVNVSETLPAGLTLGGPVTGAGWDCGASSGQTVSCTSTGDIGAGAQYQPLTIPYHASFAACPGILGAALVTSNSLPQSYTIDALPVTGCMKILNTHPVEKFPLTTNAGNYTLTASYLGLGNTPLTGQITVKDQLFLGLTPTAQVEDPALNPDWTCKRSQSPDDQTWSVTCTRAAPGAYGSITVPVDVGPDACPSQISTASVLLNGLLQSGASTTADIAAGCPSGQLDVTTTSSTSISPGKAVVYTLTATNTGTATVTSEVIVKDIFNLGLTPGIPSGDGWDCRQSSGQIVTCSRTSELAAGDSYPAIRVSVTPDVQACPRAQSTVGLTLGGKSIALTQPVSSVNLRGCITVSPTSLTFPPTSLGTSQTLPVTLTSNDAAALKVTVPQLAAGSPYSLAIPGCDDSTKDCIRTLSQGQSVLINVVYNPICVGVGHLGTLSYTTDVPSSNTVPLSGSSKLASSPVFFRLGGDGSSLDGTSVPPAVAFDLGLQTVPAVCRDNSGQVTAKVKYGKLVRPADKVPVQYDANVADCSKAGCAGTFDPGTVGGNITLEARFFDKQGNDVAYPGGLPTATVTVPLSKPVLTSVTKGAVSPSSFTLNVAGYSTPREDTTQNPTTEACFKFTAAPGTVLNAGDINGCFAKDAIAVFYDRSTLFLNGSKFTTAVTFSFAGDAAAVGSVETWLRNGQTPAESDHSCLDFKSGSTKAGACTQ